jgi:hypothetical protein
MFEKNVMNRLKMLKLSTFANIKQRAISRKTCLSSGLRVPGTKCQSSIFTKLLGKNLKSKVTNTNRKLVYNGDSRPEMETTFIFILPILILFLSRLCGRGRKFLSIVIGGLEVVLSLCSESC